MILTGEKPKFSEKTPSCATLFATNLKWTGLGSILDLRGESPATNRLSHGTDLKVNINLNYYI
jgi:hypothetical protein